MTDQAAELSCSACDAGIDRCEFCEETDCAKPVCYECMTVALGQVLWQPHVHGG